MDAAVKREWVVDIVQRLPAGLVSRAWGWLARRERPRLGVAVLKRWFVWFNGLDLTEAGHDVDDYATLEDLFVRRLKHGARRVDPDGDAVVSPVDGKVGACGTVVDGLMLQIKGRSYSLSGLLDDAREAERYEGGPYATVYLAPKDYHRIHAPLAGEVREAALIPGRLLPVFPESLEKVEELFAKNERLITYLDTPDAGRVAVVKVGATLVGRISLAYDAEARTNRAGQARRTLDYAPPRPIKKGGDLGAFELGSTVVLVGERGRVSFDELEAGQVVRVGQRIGTILSSERRVASKVRRRGQNQKTGVAARQRRSAKKA